MIDNQGFENEKNDQGSGGDTAVPSRRHGGVPGLSSSFDLRRAVEVAILNCIAHGGFRHGLCVGFCQSCWDAFHGTQSVQKPNPLVRLGTLYGTAHDTPPKPPLDCVSPSITTDGKGKASL